MGSDSCDKATSTGGEKPNDTTGGIHPYGSGFFTVIQRYTILSTSTESSNGVQPVLKEDFYQWYGVDEAGESVITAGMILAGDGSTLVVVGSTRGTNPNGPFG